MIYIVPNPQDKLDIGAMIIPVLHTELRAMRLNSRSKRASEEWSLDSCQCLPVSQT